MGEAKRRKEAAYRDGPWPGSAGRCPVCFGVNVTLAKFEHEGPHFYAKELAVCRKCEIAWEPINEADIWDRDDPACGSKEPCDNCAFRPGSVEQQDTAEWKELIEKLKAGGQFYCHKGVPIAPDGEHGFAYPKDLKKLRICRGYLNLLGAVWKKEAPATEETM